MFSITAFMQHPRPFENQGQKLSASLISTKRQNVWINLVHYPIPFGCENLYNEYTHRARLRRWVSGFLRVEKAPGERLAWEECKLSVLFLNGGEQWIYMDSVTVLCKKGPVSRCD
jgi:hypothetical protein